MNCRRIWLSCILLILPIVVMSQCDFTFDLGNDTILCENESYTINATNPNGIYYLWQDASSSPEYTVTQEGTYSCEIFSNGDDLILNGDFELGDTLFSSEYIVGLGGPWGQLSNAGTYAINTNPNNTHENFAFCSDHTSGSGNMMIVNGSILPEAVIWSQTIVVQPNSYYQFSTWLTSVVADNPALLQFSINGENLGIPFSPGFSTCDWQQFDEVWNSGTSSTAIISIVNQNTEEGGNDFAIDDVVFYELCSVSDSIMVSYTPLPNINLGPDSLICENDPLVLNVASVNANYLWQDGSTASTYTVLEAGLYWSKISVDGCANSDSVYFETMDCNVDLQIPNIFTPNHDGLNDFFRPLSTIGIVSLHTTIFNRWGTIVFESSDPLIHWDGGEEKEGTFFWIASYEGIDGASYKQNGYITLSR